LQTPVPLPAGSILHVRSFDASTRVVLLEMAPRQTPRPARLMERRSPAR
jgi:hypothetical protein